MKPTSLNYTDYARLQIELEKKNEYANALIVENKRLQKQLDAIKEDGFCLSCKGCNAPINPDSIRWCTAWQWRGADRSK